MRYRKKACMPQEWSVYKQEQQRTTESYIYSFNKQTPTLIVNLDSSMYFNSSIEVCISSLEAHILTRWVWKLTLKHSANLLFLSPGYGTSYLEINIILNYCTDRLIFLMSLIFHFHEPDALREAMSHLYLREQGSSSNHQYIPHIVK